MESTPEAHVQRVKTRLESGREILEHLSNLATYELHGTKPDLEQITLPPPLPDDYFYVATDERDPEALEVIRDAGAVLMMDLLTMEDQRDFGRPLIITDMALVEQAACLYNERRSTVRSYTVTRHELVSRGDCEYACCAVRRPTGDVS
jgi:hypothetical protein